jgi:hypothetical protein
MGVLKKAVSATGPVMRVLLGAGALLMLVIGIKNRPVKRPGNTGSEKTASSNKSKTR